MVAADIKMLDLVYSIHKEYRDYKCSLLDHFLGIAVAMQPLVLGNQICTHIVCHALWSLYFCRSSTCEIRTNRLDLVKKNKHSLQIDRLK